MEIQGGFRIVPQNFDYDHGNSMVVVEELWDGEFKTRMRENKYCKSRRDRKANINVCGGAHHHQQEQEQAFPDHTMAPDQVGIQDPVHMGWAGFELLARAHQSQLPWGSGCDTYHDRMGQIEVRSSRHIC
jgi:hypothetical protein